jgi:transketolase
MILTYKDPTRDPKILSHRIRKHVLNMTSLGKSSHIGSVYSMADIVGTLYACVANVFPDNPNNPERDRIILSKGHAGAGIYAALAERGFFDVALLAQHYQNGSVLSGHVSHKGVPGVEISTGSLGHGLGLGAGLALAAKKAKSKWRCFVILSDGECDEGSTWEAAMFAAHHRLNNLVAIVDYNKIQSLASVAETLGLEPFAEKWRAFGFEVREVNGHNCLELEKAMAPGLDGSKPLVVIAHTIKGKGVSFMENSVLWHYRSAQGAELTAAQAELDEIDPEQNYA